MKEHLVKCQLEVKEDNTNGNIFEDSQRSYNDTIDLLNEDNLSLKNSISNTTISTLQLFSYEVCETNKKIDSTSTISNFSSSIIKKGTPQTFTNSIGDFVI
uniref:Uncharacterized protein n=1 Tax=Sipha flava TaxID=143950 RepID=A0A2S2R2R0_9HEMI